MISRQWVWLGSLLAVSLAFLLTPPFLSDMTSAGQATLFGSGVFGVILGLWSMRSLPTGLAAGGGITAVALFLPVYDVAYTVLPWLGLVAFFLALRLSRPLGLPVSLIFLTTGLPTSVALAVASSYFKMPANLEEVGITWIAQAVIVAIIIGLDRARFKATDHRCNPVGFNILSVFTLPLLGAFALIVSPSFGGSGAVIPIDQSGVASNVLLLAVAILWIFIAWLVWSRVDESRLTREKMAARFSSASNQSENHSVEPQISTGKAGNSDSGASSQPEDVFGVSLLHDQGQWKEGRVSDTLETVIPIKDPAAFRPDSTSSQIHPSDIEHHRALLEEVRRHGHSHARYRLRTSEGEWRWYFVKGVAAMQDAGDLGGLQVLLLHIDITSLKENENQVVQSSKMATLGEMTAGVAHEINQPLNVIRLATQNLLRRVRAGDMDAGYFEAKLSRVANQTKRAAAIIDHMRIFGRKPAEEPEEFSPVHSIRSLIDMLAPQFRTDDVRLSVELDCEAISVWGHPSLFEQVMINLLVNARDAILENKPGGSREIYLLCHCPNDATFQVRVRDTGGGVPDRALARLFQPFFTTKPVGKGTGLGLSLSYGIIQDMGGDIKVRNVAAGAEFLVSLPAAPVQETAPAQAS